MELDLHDPQDRERARALAADAHVVIENFRPGVMDGWGLGPEDLRRGNDGLIYVSLPGYAASDPRADLPAWEGAVLAESGLLTDLSFWGAAFSLTPVFTALPLPSVYAALHASIGTVAALVGRARDGHGDHVTAPLLDAAMSAAAGPLLRTVGQPKRYNEPALPTRLIDGLDLRTLPPGLAAGASRVLNGQMPPWFRNYRCADGRDLFVIVIDNQNHIDKLLRALELDAFAADVGLQRGDVLDAPPLKDNVYAYRSNTRALKRLQRRMQGLFATRPAAHWEQVLGEAGVPCAMQRTTNEWRALSPVQDSGLVVTHRSADGTTFGAPGLVADVHGDGVDTAELSIDAAPAPFNGWLTAEEPVFASPTIDAEPQPPLAGMKVLDLANVIAGPTVSRTLAELGADVLHIDPVTPRMGPRMLLWIGQEVNQGKRSAAVDLTTGAGDALMERLLREVDAVVYNKLPSQAQKLGAAPAQVHAANPAVVVSAVTAWGGSRSGGWEDRPAYDPAIQAGTGVMSRYGGLAAPAVHGVAACIDYATGFAGAFGTLVGLWARTQGATEVVCRTSLARIAGWVQLPFMIGDVVDEPTGLTSGGWSATDRLLRTEDGWVYLALPAAAWSSSRAALSHAFGVPLCPEQQQAAPQVARALKALPTADAVRQLRAAGLSVGEVKDVGRLRRDARHTAQQDLSIHEETSGDVLLVDQGPGRGPVYLPNPTWLRWSGRPRGRLSTSPLPGAQTRAVLKEPGLLAETSAWSRGGAVSGSWSLPTGPLPQ
ncbi:CoA transferase [Quadrisphaera sp. KR29]|uniref:CoA transferase n=1 Tax=Quadrisphaera sp. KR29 TaxID=3461391 RepID=UPI004043C90C